VGIIVDTLETVADYHFTNRNAILAKRETGVSMKRKLQQRKKVFCTECGSDLDDFWLYREGEDYADILKSHFECQRSGKFKGAMCSKLFIAESGTSSTVSKKSKLSRKDLATLKSSVMSKINKESTKLP